ncbi:MAG: alpha/beta hydrolase [Caldisericia bacterium]
MLKRFKKILSIRLFLWGLLSILISIIFLFFKSEIISGLKIQFLLWGIINLTIALFGIIKEDKKFNLTKEEYKKELTKIRNILKVNTFLDIFYILIGLFIIVIFKINSSLIGHGIGVIIQGLFLFFFDFFHFLNKDIEKYEISENIINIFKDPLHEEFFFNSKEKFSLLIHGFPGTPKEMRDLGELLNQKGYDVKGILLPGFGKNLNELYLKNHYDWIDYIKKSFYENLKSHYKKKILVGYSMGAMLSILTVKELPIDMLILFAPYYNKINFFKDLYITLLTSFLHQKIKPLKKLKKEDLSKLSEEIKSFLPILEFNKVDFDKDIKNLEIPLFIFDELNIINKKVDKIVKEIDIDTIIFVGTDDKLSKIENIKILKKKFKKEPKIYILNSDHHIVEKDKNIDFEKINRIYALDKICFCIKISIN